MRYTIDRGICDLLRVDLNGDEAVIAEVGKLVYIQGAVAWNVVLPGHGLAGKVAAGFKRKLSSGSVVMTEYAGPGTVGVAGDHPGCCR